MNINNYWIKIEDDWKISNYIDKLDNNHFIMKHENKEYIVNDIIPYKELNYKEIHDVINLPLLDEPSILETIHTKYNYDLIYTNCGEILITINPFKITSMYNHNIKELYNKNNQTEAHIYNIVNKSYEYLSKFNKNQSILISGESGAGKTQSTKIVMDYLSYISNKDINNNIEEKVLYSNPILESFGNAKTIKNDNSSRFGKFIKIIFNKDNTIIGGHIETFLLEKIRVSKQNSNERNFHIFYEFLNGISFEEREYYGINKFYDVNSYLTNGLLERNDYDKNGKISDKNQFINLCKILNNIGIDQENIKKIFNIISFILLLGTSEYKINIDKMSFIGRLINSNVTSLMDALYVRRIIVNNESIHMDQTQEEFYVSRDSLATKLYSRLFTYIVDTINNTIHTDKSNLFIGILDIFGFESVEKNSFEQLCINYTNETLQQQFNKYTLDQEQKEYIKEGINWNYVEFKDNIECIKLIGGKYGVFDILDEQSKISNGSDHTFLNRISSSFIENDYFINDNKLSEDFVIKHYAGNIKYNIEDFCKKNKDISTNEISKIINNISLFKDGNNYENENLSRIGSKTISMQFKSQMNDLMNIIEKTGIHYIRCFKPNDLNKPNTFDRIKILEQLKNNGILEAIKVSRCSYPIKYNYVDFLKSYGIIDNIYSMLEEKNIEGIDNSDYQFGKTKIFLKTIAFKILENKKEEKLFIQITKIQSMSRMSIKRTKYKKYLKSIIKIQSIGRRYISYMKYLKILSNNAAIKIQQYFRKYYHLAVFKIKKESINIIKRSIKLKIKKKKIKSIYIIIKFLKNIINKKNNNVIKIQSLYRSYTDNKRYSLYRNNIIKFQKIIRKKLFNIQKLKKNIEILNRNLIKKENEYIQLKKDSDDKIKDLFNNLAEQEIVINNKDNIIKELNIIIRDLNNKIISNNQNKKMDNETELIIKKLNTENKNLLEYKTKYFNNEMNIVKLREDNNSYVNCLKKNIDQRIHIQQNLEEYKEENKYLRDKIAKAGYKISDYVLL